MSHQHARKLPTIKVKIDKDLADMLPNYLANRKKDMSLIEQALQKADLKTVTVTAHKMAGNAGGYGLAELGEMARIMENHAKVQNIPEVISELQKMKDYLDLLEIEFQ